MYRRLDYFIISNTLQDCVKSILISNSNKSDHSPVSLIITPDIPIEKGPGLWRYNFSLNQNIEFCSRANIMFDDLNTELNPMRPKEKFDFMKFKFKNLARDFSIKLAKSEKLKEKNLADKIKKLEEKANDNDFDELEKTKGEYNAIQDKKLLV